MPARTALNLNASVGVSLVNGDSATRHARQIMLRSLGYNVRSYATCVALLADPRARDQQCIIVDIDTPKVDELISCARCGRAAGEVREFCWPVSPRRARCCARPSAMVTRYWTTPLAMVG